MKRTEEQILSKAPIEVTFGEKKYQIKPLTILRQRQWRSKLSEDLKDIVSSFERKDASSAALATGLTKALLEFPEKLAELVFSYDPSLPKEQILDEATEEQIALAFSAIMAVAFPFLAQLGQVTGLMRAGLSQ